VQAAAAEKREGQSPSQEGVDKGFRFIVQVKNNIA